MAKQKLPLLRREAQVQISYAGLELPGQRERLCFGIFPRIENRDSKELYGIVRCIFTIGRCAVVRTRQIDFINIPVVRNR